MRRDWVRWIARARGKLIAVPIVVAAVWVHGDVSMDTLLWPTGLAIVGIGVFVRVWARLHIRDGSGRPIGPATTGPYALVRHPLYVGNTLLFFGTGFLTEVPWAPPVILVWCALVYEITARHEERRCLEKYGSAYRAYMSVVPRWGPRPLREGFRVLGTGRLSLAARAEWPCLVLVLIFLVRDLLVPAI